MASSLMHLAIAKEIYNKISIGDENRFYIGSILPDSGLKKSTHFTMKLDNGSKKTLNTELFYREFSDKIISDSLYLGYYFHLIEDIIFRQVLYYEFDLKSARQNPNFISDLHMDYSILNDYIIKKYKLKNNLFIPNEFTKEPLCQKLDLDINTLLNECDVQFTEKFDQEPKYLTKEIADVYIQKCVEVCLSEYNSVTQGNKIFDCKIHAW